MKIQISERNQGGKKMPYAVIYALIGYLSGSVLYAEVFCGIFGRKNAIEQSRDANPGTANAFYTAGSGAESAH